MYEGLYDTRQGLSNDDAQVVGDMTAELLSNWPSWVHRRVEHLTFCDEDAVRRNVSIDFTLPHWFHEFRDTPNKKPRRALVPLGYWQKAVLVNFSLQDEAGASLPLLTAPQHAQVAEAILVSSARGILNEEVPQAIRADIRNVVRQGARDAEEAHFHLLNDDDPSWKERQTLRNNTDFASTATLLRDNFIVMTMLPVRRHERRVLHVSHENLFWDRSNFRIPLRQMWRLINGHPRVLFVDVPSVSESDSYHVELEAPDGFMITRRESYFRLKSNRNYKREKAPGGYRRAHFHFADVAARTKATVIVHLRPRRSNIVRAATLMAVLAFCAVSAVTARYAEIEAGDNAAAAALLLAVAGVIGLIVVRSGEDELATTLLFPLRVLAVVPVGLSGFAAIVVVMKPSNAVGYSVLGFLSLCTFICVVLLVRNYVAISYAIRRYARKAAHSDDEASYQ